MTKEDAIERLKRWKCEVNSEEGYAEYLEGWFYKDDEIAFDMAIVALSEQQDIVHCSECIHCHTDDFFHDYWCSGRAGAINVWRDHFCSCGKRRGEDDGGI